MKEIVIKVSDELLSFVYQNGFVPSEKRDELNHAILECVELPKEHGELKDANKIEEALDLVNPDNKLAEALKNIIETVPTLVDADKGE